jgi:hypothetical protein
MPTAAAAMPPPNGGPLLEQMLGAREARGASRDCSAGFKS